MLISNLQSQSHRKIFLILILHSTLLVLVEAFYNNLLNAKIYKIYKYTKEQRQLLHLIYGHFGALRPRIHPICTIYD